LLPIACGVILLASAEEQEAVSTAQPFLDTDAPIDAMGSAMAMPLTASDDTVRRAQAATSAPETVAITTPEPMNMDELWIKIGLIFMLALVPGFSCRCYQMRCEVKDEEPAREDANDDVEEEDERGMSKVSNASPPEACVDAPLHAGCGGVPEDSWGKPSSQAMDNIDSSSNQERSLEEAPPENKRPGRLGDESPKIAVPIAVRHADCSPRNKVPSTMDMDEIRVKVPKERQEALLIPYESSKVPLEVQLKAHEPSPLAPLSGAAGGFDAGPVAGQAMRQAISRAGSGQIDLANASQFQSHVCGISCGSSTCWMGTLGAATALCDTGAIEADIGQPKSPNVVPAALNGQCTVTITR
jgi:hypothetical protein